MWKSHLCTCCLVIAFYNAHRHIQHPLNIKLLCYVYSVLCMMLYAFDSLPYIHAAHIAHALGKVRHVTDISLAYYVVLLMYHVTSSYDAPHALKFMAIHCVCETFELVVYMIKYMGPRYFKRPKRILKMSRRYLLLLYLFNMCIQTVLIVYYFMGYQWNVSLFCYALYLPTYVVKEYNRMIQNQAALRSIQ